VTASDGVGLRLGVVRYLNALPLEEGLENDPRVSVVVRAEPSELAHLLVRGELDAVMGPVEILVEHPDYCHVDGPVVACDGEVGTVLVHSRVPFEQIDRVRADPASRTSNALARQVLERLSHHPVEVGNFPDAPALVVIGDEAFAPSAPDHPHVLDLGLAWKQLTGLPFVFAAWIAVDDSIMDELTEIVEAAAARGLERLDEIAMASAPRIGISPERALDYLRHKLLHHMTEPMRQALQRYLATEREWRTASRRRRGSATSS